MIFITGASGFVGKTILTFLGQLGMPVCKLDRSNQPPPHVCLHSENNIIVHCAWAGVLGVDRNDKIQSTNIALTHAVANLAIRCRAKKVIAFGSQAEYGISDHVTTEETPLRPITLYGKTKVECHQLLRLILNQHEIPLTWLRLYDPYGPGDNPKWFLPYVICSALLDRSPDLTECTQVWDYLYIDDVSRLVTEIIQTPIKHDCTFNLSSGLPVSLRDVVELVFTSIKPKTAIPRYGALDFRPDQQFYVVGSCDRLTKATQWKPSTDLKTGIRETIKYFRTQIDT
jgi:UDP-glucose 4-epimerase